MEYNSNLREKKLEIITNFRPYLAFCQIIANKKTDLSKKEINTQVFVEFIDLYEPLALPTENFVANFLEEFIDLHKSIKKEEHEISDENSDENNIKTIKIELSSEFMDLYGPFESNDNDNKPFEDCFNSEKIKKAPDSEIKNIKKDINNNHITKINFELSTDYLDLYEDKNGKDELYNNFYFDDDDNDNKRDDGIQVYYENEDN